MRSSRPSRLPAAQKPARDRAQRAVTQWPPLRKPRNPSEIARSLHRRRNPRLSSARCRCRGPIGRSPTEFLAAQACLPASSGRQPRRLTPESSPLLSIINLERKLLADKLSNGRTNVRAMGLGPHVRKRWELTFKRRARFVSRSFVLIAPIAGAAGS